MSTKRHLRTESYMKQTVIEATKGIIHNAGYRSIPKYQEKAEKENHKKINTQQRKKKQTNKNRKKGEATKNARIQHTI